MTRLDAEERRLEEEIDRMVSVNPENRSRIDGIHSGARKSRAISLRIGEYDSGKIKEKAAKEGPLPNSYQYYPS